MPKTVPRQLAAGKQQLKCCRSGAAERYTPVDFDQPLVMKHFFVNSSRHAVICLQVYCQLLVALENDFRIDYAPCIERKF